LPNPTMQVFDKNFKRLGTLIDAYDIERRRRLNSDYELSFFVPMSSDDYLEKIQQKGHVMDERGQYYVINSRKRDRSKKKLTALITATHVMFKLNDYKVPYDDYIAEAYGVHISTLLDKISGWTGGRFTFQVHDTFDLWDIKDFGRTNALAALNQVVNLFGAEIRPDNFVIHIYKKIGSQTDRYEYRTKKNIISDSFKDDATGLVTRMYAQMKDGRTWVGMSVDNLTDEERSLLQSVPGAITNGKVMVNYLLSPYVNDWGSDSVPFFDGENVQQDIEDPIELLKSTREELRKKEIQELEINLDAADLHKIDRDERPPDLGDAATVYDPDMEMNRIAVRIVELTEYPYSIDQHSKVTLANFMLKDDIDLIADLERSRKVMENLLSGGRIRTEVFEAATRQAIADINNSKTELIYPPEGGILAQEKTNPLEQLRLTSKGIGISTDGWQTVRTAITARGIAAEVITGQLGSFVSLLIGSGNDVTQINPNGIAAGHADFNSAPFRVDMKGNLVANKLTANSAQINTSNLNSSTWKDGYFTGNITAQGEITGGTLTGALIRTAASGQRIEVSSPGLKAIDNVGRTRISISQSGRYGVAGTEYFDNNGAFQGIIAGLDDGFYIEAGQRINIYASLIDFNGGTTDFMTNVDFSSNVDFTFADSVTGLTMSSISGLLSALAGKVPYGTPTTSVSGGAHNHGFPHGTQFKDVNGVVYTWSAYSGFTHAHAV
jgi:hypothetical protein